VLLCRDFETDADATQTERELPGVLYPADVNDAAGAAIASATVLHGPRLVVGAHARAGLMAWGLDDAWAAWRVLDATPRAGPVVALDADRVLYAVPGELRTWSADQGVKGVARHASRVVCLGVTGSRVRVIRADGSIHTFDRNACESIGIESIGVPVMAAAVHGAMVAYAGVDGRVHARVGSEKTIDFAGVSGAEMVACAGGLVAMATPDRQRLVCWDAREPGRPVHDLLCPTGLPHRVADIAGV
jgi:hypothetical protein